MNAPKITENIGSITYSWEDLGLEVIADRVSDEGIAELWFYSPNGNGKKLLHTTRANLMATNTMSSITKRMGRHSDKIPWTDVMTYITGKTMEIIRRGEPLRVLGNKPEKMALDYTLYPILEKGQPTTIFAPGGSGKSYLASYIACLVQFAGGGIHAWYASSPGNVLYLDWEADYEVHTRRVWAIKQGLPFDLGVNEEGVFLYQYCSQPLVSIIDRVRKIVSDKEITFVIIDSQMAASGTYPGDPSFPITQFFSALRSLKCTTLIIDHENKTGELYGSITKTNRARSQYTIIKDQRVGNPFIEIALKHEKHNEGMLQETIGIKIEFTNKELNELHKVVFSECEVKDNEVLSQTALTVVDRAHNALLANGRLSLPDLAKMLKVKEGTLKAELYDHKDLFIYLKEYKQWGAISNLKE